MIERPRDLELAPTAHLPSAAELWGSLAGAEDSDHLMTIDGQGIITWINRVAAGVTPEQVIGHNVLDLCPSGERPALESWLSRAREGESMQPLIGSFPTANGLRYYDCRCTPVRRAGKLLVLLVQARDVTSEHQDREALVTSEQRFRALLEHSPDAICLFDSIGVIRFANPATRRILDYDFETLFGTDGWKMFHPDDVEPMRKAQLEIHQRPGEPILVPPFRARHHDGSWRWIETVATNLLDIPAVKAVMGIYRDVSARMQHEDDLRRTQKRETIGLLAGGVAHEFNNLLTVILASADSARRLLDADHPVQEDLINIHNGARSGAELIQKLLTFSRRQTHVRGPFDLRETVLGLGSSLRRVAGGDVTVEVDPGPDALPVEGVEGQIQQLLLNLATNARQAMPGGGRLRVTARRLPDAGTGAGAEVEVSDSGLGMDAATQEQIFEPFFSTRPGGIGLGLPVAQMVVEDHRGSIEVRSERGRGTTVRVRLPLRAQATTTADPQASLRGRETILVVEDEVLLRDLLARSLRALGYSVITAADGEEALAVFGRTETPVDLVVLDLIMPRMGGREAAGRLSAIRPDLKLVLMTGYTPDAPQLDALLVPGRVALMHKPFVANDLAAQMRALLDGPQS